MFKARTHFPTSLAPSPFCLTHVSSSLPFRQHFVNGLSHDQLQDHFTPLPRLIIQGHDGEQLQAFLHHIVLEFDPRLFATKGYHQAICLSTLF